MDSHYFLGGAARVFFVMNVALPAVLLVMSLFDGHS